MRPDLVVDIGNTRMKWGLCQNPASADPIDQYAALPAENAAAWEGQIVAWNLRRPLAWVVSSVNPQTSATLLSWLERRGDTVKVLDRARELPLQVRVEYPDRVGIDRLLNAVAANARRRENVPAVIIDAGSAVTVDWVARDGAFEGGAILPGLRLMGHALHDYTALLPLTESWKPTPAVPGRCTPTAIEAGVYWTAAGGIRALVEQMANRAGDSQPASFPKVFLTGGDAAILEPGLKQWSTLADLTVWPFMTLQGIRLTAEALP